jgi:uncharacterized protein (TIGR03437 family)
MRISDGILATLFIGTSLLSAAEPLTAVSQGGLLTISGGKVYSTAALPPAVGSSLPVIAGEIEVMVGGAPAPILSITPQGVTFQLPYEVAPLGDVWVWVRVAGRDEDPIRLDSVAAVPSLFTIDDTGRAAAFIAGTQIPVDENRPANGGELLEVFATGLGMSPDAPPTGSPAPAAPVAVPMLAVSATIAGQPAEVVDARLAPGYVGVWVVTVRVPRLPDAGMRMPLTLAAGGRNSEPVALAVNPVLADFGLTLTQERLVLAPGDVGRIGVKASATGEGSRAYSLKVTFTGLPTGVTASPDALDVPLGQTASVTFSADAFAPPAADVLVAVKGVAESRERTANLKLAVDPSRWTIGNGRIADLAFSDASEPISEESKAYIRKFIADAYPVMEEIFGPPVDTFTLTLRQGCGWGYDGNRHLLCYSTAPQPDASGIDESFDQVFLHELGLAFFLSERWNDPNPIKFPNWIQEPLPDAALLWIGWTLKSEGIRPYKYLGTAVEYDLWMPGGRDILAGAPGKSWRPFNPAGRFLNQAGAGELFMLLNATQSPGARPGAWREGTAIRRVRDELFRISASKQATPDQEDFLEAVRRTCPGTIDGEPFAPWLERQPFLHTRGNPGTYLFAFPSNGINMGAVIVAAFERLETDYVPGVREERQATSGVVRITISGANGVVDTMDANLAEEARPGVQRTEWWQPSFSLPTGGYRIQAAGTVNGLERTSADTYFAWIFLPEFLRAEQKPESCLVLIGTTEDGSVSPKPFAPIPGGSFIVNENGVAVWRPDDYATTPLPRSVVVNGKTISLPLPFSRTVAVPNP